MYFMKAFSWCSKDAIRYGSALSAVDQSCSLFVTGFLTFYNLNKKLVKMPIAFLNTLNKFLILDFLEEFEFFLFVY